ncbi:hypothetical protein LOK49_LG08G02864 [Camellia lanceoleosa]|uniref:Uncharacterized protein n=1 Tax=Camellia lanceoleosa TaxID=1840588 RepID=A0ACC0GP72_9ERIC|nr:hypothetical protein LOK49_LG08G02864 [Camellia lanceoleosa]
MDDNNNYRLKRLRTLADVWDSGRRERWRQHKALLYSLDSTASAPPIKHNQMGSTTSDRNRRNPSFIVFSDDEDDDDTKKLAKPEPKKQELEQEPSQPYHYMAHVPDDIMSAILSRIPWKSISRLQCVRACTGMVSSTLNLHHSPFILYVAKNQSS